MNFKARYKSHVCLITNDKYSNSTKLEAYIRDLKVEGLKSPLEWSVISKDPRFSTGVNKCFLCIRESLVILRSFGLNILNKFTDVIPFRNHKFSPTFLRL